MRDEFPSKIHIKKNINTSMLAYRNLSRASTKTDFVKLWHKQG